jgi:hypothetical protein
MSAHHSFGLELQPHLYHNPPQAIAVNALYEHVDIQSQGQLERFDRRLRQIAGPLAYPDITDKICILSIDVHPWESHPANGDATWNCVIAILMQSRRLHAVRLISPCAMRCHLLCLSCPGREYITSLDLVLPDIRQGFSSMVPQFTRLYKRCVSAHKTLDVQTKNRHPEPSGQGLFVDMARADDIEEHAPMAGFMSVCFEHCVQAIHTDLRERSCSRSGPLPGSTFVHRAGTRYPTAKHYNT